MESTISKIIMEAIEELNEQLDDEYKVEYSDELKLLGSHSKMDSMTLLTFISIIEDLLSDEFDKSVKLVSDKAFSRERSPFYSIKTLKEFIMETIDGEEAE